MYEYAIGASSVYLGGVLGALLAYWLGVGVWESAVAGATAGFACIWVTTIIQAYSHRTGTMIDDILDMEERVHSHESTFLEAKKRADEQRDLADKLGDTDRRRDEATEIMKRLRDSGT